MPTRYTRDHEWIRLDGDLATVGITDYAQEQLGDIVFVELPEIGRKLDKGAEAAVVESVKAASDVYAPLAGEIVGGNEALAGSPEAVNEDAYAAWLFRLRPSDAAAVDAFLDAAAYSKLIADA
jgi:glycine cleavage system H protein